MWMKLNKPADSQPFFHLPWGSAAFSSVKAEAALRVESALGFHSTVLGQALSLAPGEREGSPITAWAMWAGGCDLRLGVPFRLASR